MPSLSGKIALITGASRGIGAAVAVRFAAEGAHVILAARDVKGLEATDDAIRAKGGKATLVPCDVRDSSLIEDLARQVGERFGHLDIVVGNAGVLGELAPLADITPDIWAQVMNVNLTANWQLIRCFDALLKKSTAGRAMFVTSGLSETALAYWGPYSASKAGLDMLVKIYAAENAKTKLKINLIDPGEVRTRMHAQAMPGQNPEELPLPEAITDIFVKLADANLKETGKKFYVR